MITRRQIITTAAFTAGAAFAAKIPRAIADQSPTSNSPPATGNSLSNYTPVHTLNGTTLPSKTIDGVKIMHLIAGEIEHEFAPGLKAHCWGYNGRTPGPTIEAVAGDRLRIYVTNRLPAPTTVHWHGIRIINGMDGVNGLTQPAIQPNQTFRYEFTVPEPGTFMYHPHFDEMTQQGMGMMGMFIVHPRVRAADAPDRDYVIMLSEWRIDPGASRPVTTEMTDFNILTMNSKCYPATEPVVAQMGERIRLRFGNLGAMEHHPIHLHGFQMNLVETDGGIVPESARYPANTVLVPVGSTRAMEFIADNPGDWPMHCHMTHHTMTQMGHGMPNLIGVDTSKLDPQLQKHLPGYMSMGQTGMSDMAEMSMAVPGNSTPMVGGSGPHGYIDMGGMFTILKVRDTLADYDTDPGWYQAPPGTIAGPATADELRHDLGET
jgi:FtsP/CotA-like multicopper oxidase with cupredoxin domain